MAKKYLISDFLKRIKRPVELKNNEEYKLVTVKMNHNGVVLRERRKGSEIKSNMFLVKEGDFILSGIDARNGAFGIIPDELNNAIVTNDFWYFEIDENIISKELFLELTATNWFDDICKKGSDGTTQRIRLQKGKFFNQTVQLPEKFEQKEILSKISLFKQDLKIFKQENEIQKNRLSKLCQSILQEAIQGKLTAEWREQNPCIEPATELIKRIKAEKEQSIKEKKIKREKPVSPISKDEIPFELPQGWMWCRLGEIAQHNSGKTLHKGQNKGKLRDYITTSNLYWNKFELDNIKQIKIEEKELERFTAIKGDLLICEGGDVGRAAIWDKDYDICFQNHIHRVRVYSSISVKYLYYNMMYLYGNRVILSYKKGMGIPNLSGMALSSIVIPLPSFLEQQAIVSKLETLLEKCNKLQEEIEKMNKNSKELLRALFNETFKCYN